MNFKFRLPALFISTYHRLSYLQIIFIAHALSRSLNHSILWIAYHRNSHKNKKIKTVRAHINGTNNLNAWKDNNRSQERKTDFSHKQFNSTVPLGASKSKPNEAIKLRLNYQIFCFTADIFEECAPKRD